MIDSSNRVEMNLKWKGLPVMCGPRGLPPETPSFYENDGHRHFTDVSTKGHIAGPKTSYGFSPVTGDFDNDRYPDIFVASDSTASLYYRNLQGKGFDEEVPKTIIEGRGTMPAFDQRLRKDEVDALLKYLHRLN
jgi:hypothetical protein